MFNIPTLSIESHPNGDLCANVLSMHFVRFQRTRTPWTYSDPSGTFSHDAPVRNGSETRLHPREDMAFIPSMCITITRLYKLSCDMVVLIDR